MGKVMGVQNLWRDCGRLARHEHCEAFSRVVPQDINTVWVIERLVHNSDIVGDEFFVKKHPLPSSLH